MNAELQHDDARRRLRAAGLRWRHAARSIMSNLKHNALAHRAAAGAVAHWRHAGSGLALKMCFILYIYIYLYI